MKKINVFKTILVLVLVAITGTVSAQVSDPGCDPLDPSCPIDGGLSILIAAGIGLAARRAYRK